MSKLGGGWRPPWWTVVAASPCPVLLIGGVLVAVAVQPASYDPVRKAISELAGPGGVDSWAMTSALVGVGLCCLGRRGPPHRAPVREATARRRHRT